MIFKVVFLVTLLSLTSLALGANIQSVSSGSWSNPSIWSTGNLPGAGDTVKILDGHKILFDSNATIKRLSIAGELEFSRLVSTNLELAGNLIVEKSGKLTIGTLDNPLPKTITATVVFNVADNSKFIGGVNFEETDTGLWVFGRWDSSGYHVEHTWTKLSEDAEAGTSTLIAEGDLSDWPLGSEVLITATGKNIPDSTFGKNNFFTEDEERKIISAEKIADGKTKITLNSSLDYTHVGSGETRGEIALLSRNVIITSKTDQRAHTVYMPGSEGSLACTLFKNLGPQNVFSRYPIHVHHVMADDIGKIIRCNVVWDSENRWIVIHDSLGVLVEDNVAYRGIDTGYWLESDDMGPKSVNNLFIHNLGVKLGSHDSSVKRMSVFYADRDNHFIDNVAVSATGSTDTSGFHWPEKGNDNTGHVFIENEAHSNSKHGLFGWQNSGSYHIVNFKSWRNLDAGVSWGAYSNNVQFHGLHSIGNERNFVTDSNHPYLQDSVLHGENSYPSNYGLFIALYKTPPSPTNPGKIIRSEFSKHQIADVDHQEISTCGLPSDECTPTYTAFLNSKFLSTQSINFSTHWKTTDSFFDIQNWNGNPSNLPENFRITRLDQPKPSSLAYKDFSIDGWIDSAHPQPSKWIMPPTIKWDKFPSELGNSPVVFQATASGFPNKTKDVEIWIDEFEQGIPWTAEYYDNSDLKGTPVLILNKSEINFNDRDDYAFGLGNLLNPESFSIRFTKNFYLSGGVYDLQFNGNDGIRVLLDDSVIHKNWGNIKSCSQNEPDVMQKKISAGEHKIVVEFSALSTSCTNIQFDIYKNTSSSSLTESFTFDPVKWPRKYVYVYARAHDPSNEQFDYTSVLKYRNPNFVLPASSVIEPPPYSTPYPTPSSPSPSPSPGGSYASPYSTPASLLDTTIKASPPPVDSTDNHHAPTNISMTLDAPDTIESGEKFTVTLKLLSPLSAEYTLVVADASQIVNLTENVEKIVTLLLTAPGEGNLYTFKASVEDVEILKNISLDYKPLILNVVDVLENNETFLDVNIKNPDRLDVELRILRNDKENVFTQTINSEEYIHKFKMGVPGEYKVIATAVSEDSIVDVDEYLIAVDGDVSSSRPYWLAWLAVFPVLIAFVTVRKFRGSKNSNEAQFS